jgi:hypothetical protein
MENNKLQQISFISIFKKVTNEERKVTLQHKIDFFNAYVALLNTISKQVGKWSISRSHKFVAKSTRRWNKSEGKGNTKGLKNGKRQMGSTSVSFTKSLATHQVVKKHNNHKPCTSSKQHTRSHEFQVHMRN